MRTFKGMLVAATAVAVAMVGTGCRDRVGEASAAEGTATNASTQGTGKATSGKPTQVAARVNGEEITVHQLNERGAGMAGDGSPTDSSSLQAQALNRMVELTLIRQEADAQGLAQDPVVLRQLEAARVDVLARAWAQRVSDDETPPSPQEVRRWYDEHPQAFAQRRVFQVQELRADVPEAAQAEVLKHLPSARQPQALGRVLTQGGHAWGVQAVQRGSEQMEPRAVAQLMALQPGQGLHIPGGQGLRVWWVQNSVEQPVSWAQAQAMIERLLTAQRRAERAQRELARLREAARIEYVGDFAQLAPPAAEKREP